MTSGSNRRRFLEQTAIVLSAAPFVAGTYGLFYGRLNLETTQQRIRLQRLSKAFEGFRIVQLSDLHISPFMSAEEIRRYAAIASQLKGDLVVLTGDFVTDDPAAEGAVVQALSTLKAPFGVFGCLGNHEIYTETEDSITRLFAAGGTHILRGDRVAINEGGSALNLMGVDYQSRPGRVEAPGHPVREYLQGIEQLVLPGTVNIILSHNPNTFDRAAALRAGAGLVVPVPSSLHPERADAVVAVGTQPPLQGAPQVGALHLRAGRVALMKKAQPDREFMADSSGRQVSRDAEVRQGLAWSPGKEIDQARVRLGQAVNDWCISVEDEGRGFDLNGVGGEKATSYGLKIMRERVEGAGGRLEIESNPGQGTRVTLLYPKG